MPTNFEFLKEDYPDLFDWAHDMEKKVKQDPNGAINSGSKFFERILNILLENARIPPKETYVEKIIDLKNKKVIDSKSEKLLQKARKYRNDDRHSDSSSNERVALAFLKVIFNISVWFMDDYNNKIIHNSDFDTNILTQIEKESQVSKEDVGKIVNDAVNLAMIQSSEDKDILENKILNLSKENEELKRDFESKFNDLKINYSENNKEKWVNFIADNYYSKEDVGKIVNDAVNLAMIQSSEDKANFKKELLNISKKYDSSRKNLEDKIDNLIMEYSNADLIKFVTDNYAPKDEIYKIVSNEIENLKKESDEDKLNLEKMMLIINEENELMRKDFESKLNSINEQTSDKSNKELENLIIKDYVPKSDLKKHIDLAIKEFAKTHNIEISEIYNPPEEILIENQPKFVPSKPKKQKTEPKKLNEDQEAAVMYDGKKPLLIEAGPGSGKTTVLIERVKYLLNNKCIDPESLLVITFTKKAANELKTRLSEETNNISELDVQKMQISTIHGFCAKILEKAGHVNLSIIDDDLGEKINMFVRKHLEELGFTGIAYASKRDAKNIINKYEEYCTFGVDSQNLIKYIQDNYPISQDYIDFVEQYMEENEGKFPKMEVKENKEFKQYYYNALYLQVAKSYPIYKELMEKENVIDFGHMQLKALEYLRENPDSVFKNILIDEFQDTDPIQMEIFKILMKNCDSATFVGDIDQSIYGFRGSYDNYFEQLSNEYDVKRISLNTNYRSTNQIIDVSEALIKPQRDVHSEKDLKGNRDIDFPIYYISNEDKDNEAENICEFIKYLKETGKIDNYNEIAVLTRSVTSNGNCIKPLMNLLNENNIPYAIKGNKDLLDKDEIKSILTLIYYVISEDKDHHIMNSWEKKWLNLKAFTGTDFKMKLCNLSDETKEILFNIQEQYENDVVAAEKDVSIEVTGKKSRVRSFGGVFKKYNKPEFENGQEILKDIVNKVGFPYLNVQNLEKWGIKNKDDLAFFDKLFEIRENILSEDIEYKNKLTILEIYMRLLEINDYFNADFINNPNNQDEISNLAFISNTLYNYEQMYYNKAIRGAFWFLYTNIEDYGSSNVDPNGVQLMTVHKAKGLEFPVVIVASFSDKKFPSKFISPNPDNGYIHGKPAFFTPYEFLKYKDFENESEEVLIHEEENRIIYVAMTRAQDILVLSSLVPPSDKENEITYKGSSLVEDLLINKNYAMSLQAKEIEIPKTVCKKPDFEEELLELSFTSLKSYLQCPFRNKLLNHFHFKISDKTQITYGKVIHKALEVINKRIKATGEYLGDDEVKNIVENLFYTNPNIAYDRKQKLKTDKLDDIVDNVIHYYHTFGNKIKVIDSEVQFNVKNKDYGITGAIDLIYETDNGKIGLLDYKYTSSEAKYMKWHKKQLYVYVGVLKLLEEWKDREISELKVYAIKSKKLVDVPVDHDKIKEIMDEMDIVAKNINENNYPRQKDKHCNKCAFKRICG
ncbi:UvrD-helicase domain-containing protein [Methanobrevibacter smithii]|uniref:UvrD-helicase domain-containing protein n=1 Tax=Methanobrevibacter smithii TaxID=2173 RepID=UPI0037DC3F4B